MAIRNVFDVTTRPPVWKWYLRQIMSSLLYKKGIIRGTTVSDDEKKRETLDLIRQALKQRSSRSPADIDSIMESFYTKLDDPGLLENVRFFRLWESDFMIPFYIRLWRGKMAEAMVYLHGYGWDLNGVFRKIPETDSWAKMSLCELMNCDAREKAKNVVATIKRLGAKNVISFGCGMVLERYHGLPSDFESLKLFDTADLQLEKVTNSIRGARFIRRNLFDAPQYCEPEDASLVWMTGVWPYLSKEDRVKALLVSARLLEKGGEFMFDQVVINWSLLRVAITQGWPRDPSSPMRPALMRFSAIRGMKKALKEANAVLALQGMRLSLVKTDAIRPFGATTSVQFTLRKEAFNP